MTALPSYVEIISRQYPTVQVTALGDGFDYNSIVYLGGDPIPPQADLDSARTDVVHDVVWSEIQAIRDYRKGRGVKVGAYWFHTDPDSRIQHLGLNMLGANMPPGIMWKTMTGAFVEMTQSLAGQIFVGISIKDTQTFGVAETHRANMLASATPEDYDYSTNWPQIFDEDTSA